MKKNKTQREFNYHRLKSVGFNSFEANRLKDHSKKRIAAYVELKEKHNEEMKDLIQKK